MGNQSIMVDFNTTLLREKFVIHDLMPEDLADNEPIIALSNRLVLPFKSHNGEVSETFVVRAQNMHTALRMGAHMARHFYDHGPILGSKSFDWEDTYRNITKGYEVKWNPGRWVAVYHKGRMVYESGADGRHPFLDIIEQCDARNPSDYDKTMEIAVDAFKQAGKLVNIEHDANVALVVNVTDTEGKCGVILRGPDRTTTFNLVAKKKDTTKVKIPSLLTVAAAYLEGIQLAFLVGMTNQKVRYELIKHASIEGEKGDDAGRRLGSLNSAVNQFENILDVTYRPERPNFSRMVNDAEKFAQKILADEIKIRMAQGEIDEGEWIM